MYFNFKSFIYDIKYKIKDIKINIFNFYLMIKNYKYVSNKENLMDFNFDFDLPQTFIEHKKK